MQASWGTHSHSLSFHFESSEKTEKKYYNSHKIWSGDHKGRIKGLKWHEDLFGFLVAAKSCFSLSIVEVKGIVIIEITLQRQGAWKSGVNNTEYTFTIFILIISASLGTFTLIELRYMRTSSNCLKRKKQEAMHCLPGIVSEGDETQTRSQSNASRVGIHNVPHSTAFTSGASDQLEELLSSLQVIPLQTNTLRLSLIRPIFSSPNTHWSNVLSKSSVHHSQQDVLLRTELWFRPSPVLHLSYIVIVKPTGPMTQQWRRL